jgi:hypothetical protein
MVRLQSGPPFQSVLDWIQQIAVEPLEVAPVSRQAMNRLPEKMRVGLRLHNFECDLAAARSETGSL